MEVSRLHQEIIRQQQIDNNHSQDQFAKHLEFIRAEHRAHMQELNEAQKQELVGFEASYKKLEQALEKKDEKVMALKQQLADS